MQKFLEVNQLAIAIFGISIFGFIASGFKWLSHKMKTMIEEQRNESRITNEAMIAILHNKIYKNGIDYIANECISVGDLDDLEKLYKPYNEMGGNGTAKVIMENVRKLDVCKGGIKEIGEVAIDEINK